MRAAKAAAVTAYLSDENGLGTGQSGDVTLKYDAGKGKLVATSESVSAYGKGTSASGLDSSAYTDGYTATTTGDYIEVTIKTNGEVSMAWK